MLARWLAFSVALAACAPEKDVGDGAVAGAGSGDEQTPPTGRAAVEEWLAKGFYTKWKCEPSAHPARPPGAHGMNRVCTNDRASAHGGGEFPVGAASVKELVDGQGAVTGHAVALHFRAGGGDAWYWYEKTAGGLEADGAGDSGRPKTLCASCHAGAGAGGASGHDFVFTQVK